MTDLTDSFGRAFHYLRLSLDDACNFRCLYCLPNGYHRAEQEPPLSASEIKRLVVGFSGMGFWKFRLTGGEPTVRRDFLEIARGVTGVAGVKELCLSTNGYRLASLAPELKTAGIRSVNISVDSLDRARFRQITGQDRLDDILSGVTRCLELGLKTKINVVLMKGLNDHEIGAFMDLTRDQPLSVRFIELMPTSDNKEFFSQRHVSAQHLMETIPDSGWTPQPRREGDGPARVFRREGYRGLIGIIAPYSKDFCSTCNRLRITSRGGLRLCLFGEADFSIRHWLQDDDQVTDLRQAVRDLLNRKEISHYLPQGRFTHVPHFASMGG